MTIPSYAAVHRRLTELGDPQHAEGARRFFKTGPGDYGAGDKFLGIRVPVLRELVREYDALPLPAVVKLLKSPWHEERAFAALMLVRLYGKGGSAEREAIFRLYLDSLQWINNWDLVDSSASQIVGRHLAGQGRSTLTRLAQSDHLWSRRVAVIATAHDIRQGRFADILFLARLLIDDDQDLIHKAVGWMLREVGQRDESALEGFLEAHATEMPRTMLRYAIEKLSPMKRERYMKRAPA